MGHYYTEMMLCNECGKIYCVCEPEPEPDTKKQWLVDTDYNVISVYDFEQKGKLYHFYRFGVKIFDSKKKANKYRRKLILKAITTATEELKRLNELLRIED